MKPATAASTVGGAVTAVPVAAGEAVAGDGDGTAVEGEGTAVAGDGPVVAGAAAGAPAHAARRSAVPAVAATVATRPRITNHPSLRAIDRRTGRRPFLT